MRRLAALAASAVVVLPLLAAPHASAAMTRVIDPEPQKVNIPIDAACGFPVSMSDRGGLTRITTYDASKNIVRIEVRGSTVATFTRVDNGAQMVLESRGTTVYTPNADGTWTWRQIGLGYAIDTGRFTGTPNLEWFTGAVVSTGALDLKGLAVDPSTQQRSGIAGDICEMLLTGLKTRH
ncbi:MAG: hypothetical protein ACXWZU_06025 [Actinomycetota bacterium]